MIAEPLSDLGQVVRVLQIGVRERRRARGRTAHPAPRGSFDLEAVLALEVDRVDRARGRDLVDERRRPGRLRVELEAHAGGAGEPPAHGLDRRLLAEAERVDEAHRLRLSPSTSCSERPAWRSARSSAADSNAQLRKRRAPSHSGGSGHSSSVARCVAEAGQRPLALERQRRSGLVQRGAVLAEHRDVLAQPVDAGADEPHVRRDALELVGEDGVQALVLARLDDERQLREPRPQRLAFHRGAPRIHRRHCLIRLLIDSHLSAAPVSRAQSAVAVAYRGRPLGR